MKKRLSLLLLLALVFSCIAFPVIAEDKEQVDVYEGGKLVKSVVFVIGVQEYFINGETPGIKMDATPFIQNGRTFVPIRYLGNALGVTNKYIFWNSPKVTFKEPGLPVVELSVGSKVIKSNGVSKTMDVAPVLKSGRTYLPARFVAEALGYEVAWDPQNKVVVCWPKGEEKPDYSSVLEYVKEQQPPAAGETFNPSDYSYITPRWKEELEGKNVIKISEGGFPAEGIKIDRWTTVYGVKFYKDKINITVSSVDRLPGPHHYLVEEGDVIRYHSDPLFVINGKETYSDVPLSFTASDKNGNLLRGGKNGFKDFTEIKQLILEGAENTLIIVDNPLYAGK
ncbi:MAG: copper amine oxidase N-terminal domain-containing protein [Clostridia bacterium]|nr:copper amine oxidase N-terminal domain-containing protein [Clostridia bacterium]